MDPFEKISHSVDALFGSGVSKNIPKDIDFKMSKKTGRIRAVYHNGLLLFTPRTDGGIAMSIYCAELFSKNKKFTNSTNPTNRFRNSQIQASFTKRV